MQVIRSKSTDFLWATVKWNAGMEDYLASQLPEADTLPDGFSESFSEISICTSSATKSDKKPNLEQKDNIVLDVIKSITEESTQESETVSSLYTDSCTRQASSMTETTKFFIGAATKEVEKEEVKGSQGMNQRNNNKNSRSFKLENNSEVKVKKAKGTSRLERELMDSHQKYLQMVVERDSALLELKKNIALREKLEALCRELQRQNKMLTEECRKVSTEGQEKRLELSNKFHDAIKGVSNKLEEQRDERLSQLKENEMLRDKLKQFSERYEICEQQFTQQLKKKTLELQLAEVKLQQKKEACSQEQAKVQLYTEQISQVLASEKNLRLQLAADGEKFQQFQDTLTKSNEVFESFKKKMEMMEKTINDLNKENNFLKSKCEKSDVTLIELIDERAKLKKQLEKTKNQKEKLESLCRSLQAERKRQGGADGINNTASEDSVTRDQSSGQDPGKNT